MLAVMGPLLVLGGAHYYLHDQLVYQQARNARLAREVTSLNRELGELVRLRPLIHRTLPRYEVVRQLSAGLGDTAARLAAIGNLTPAGVAVSAVQRTGTRWRLGAEASTAEQGAALVRRLEQEAPRIGLRITTRPQPQTGAGTVRFVVELEEAGRPALPGLGAD